jgi:hypothetical protein
MEKHKIPFTITNLDDAGRLFIVNGKIRRYINKKYENNVKRLFESGFIQELIEKELLVPCTLIEQDNEIYIESEVISPVIYPHEWTFNMLKKAALTVLEIYNICKKYNVKMKDCHSWNILFVRDKALYCDIGSFITNEDACFFNIKEFFESYYYPLILWSYGLEKTVKYSLLYDGTYPFYEFYFINNYFYRYILSGRSFKFYKFLERLFTLSFVSDKKLKSKVSNKLLYFIIKAIKSIMKVIFERKIKKVYNKIKKSKLNLKTEWEDYYKDKDIQLTDRMKRIITYVKELSDKAKTIVSFGSNQGYIEYEILKQTNIKRAICVDVDSKALYYGFEKYSSKVPRDKEIYFVNLDLCLPISHPYMKSTYDRFKSDIVMALALTHHLILKYGYDIDYIFTELLKYTNKYIIVEFMPLGLWTPSSKIDIPEWYSEEYFKEHFEKYFKLIKREKLEENRIVYIGEVIE